MLTATVSGRVQGVGFRWFVQRIACASGLTGYVRNTADGRVKVAAEGEDAAVRRLLDALRQGPPGSRVTAVDVSWDEATGQHRQFTIEH